MPGARQQQLQDESRLQQTVGGFNIFDFPYNTP